MKLDEIIQDAVHILSDELAQNGTKVTASTEADTFLGVDILMNAVGRKAIYGDILKPAMRALAREIGGGAIRVKSIERDKFPQSSDFGRVDLGALSLGYAVIKKCGGRITVPAIRFDICFSRI